MQSLGTAPPHVSHAPPPPPPPRKIPPRALTDLDFLRGSAAALVLANHVRGLFFVDWETLRAPSRALMALYLWGGIGHECVIVFFVLSGFFIGYSVLGAQEVGTWDWKSYALRRLTRLYVVLVPGLLLTALLDIGGMHLFGADRGIYAGDLNAPHFHLARAKETVGLGTFLGNLFFLQNLKVKEYGTNAPLWSLPYEFWYYVTFPALVRALFPRPRNRKPFLERVVGVAAVAAIFAVGGRGLLFYASIWGMGAAVAYVWLRRPRGGGEGALFARRGVAWAALAAVSVLFVGVLMAARLRRLGTLLTNDFALGVATTALVACVLATGAAREGGRGVVGRAYERLSAWMARSSFTLYVVHFPILAFLSASLGMTERWLPDARHLALGALMFVGVAVGLAYPLARVTEARTDDVRRWFERSVGFFRSPSV